MMSCISVSRETRLLLYLNKARRRLRILPLLFWYILYSIGIVPTYLYYVS